MMTITTTRTLMMMMTTTTTTMMIRLGYGFALLYFKIYFDKKLIESGVDEEEFAKFSKGVVTNKNKDEGLERVSVR